MNTVNVQKEMDKLLEKVSHDEEPRVLLLHSCCAPCSSYVLEYLSDYFEIIDLYYNPNISPETEYRARENELKRLIEQQPHKHPVTFLEGRYDPKEFLEAAKGLENEPEGGERCKKCFELRLREAAKAAKEQGADYFATSLTISPLKNAEAINAIGERVSKEFPGGAAYLPSDFKKKNGYKRSTELSKEYRLYRQDYCGCVFSKLQREREKAYDRVDPNQ